MPHLEQLVEELHRFASSENMTGLVGGVFEGEFPALYEIGRSRMADSQHVGPLSLMREIREEVALSGEAVSRNELAVVSRHYLGFPGIPDWSVPVRIENAAGELGIDPQAARELVPEATVATAQEMIVGAGNCVVAT